MRKEGISCLHGIIADLSHCGAISAKGKQVLAACAIDQHLPETTLFNCQRGLA